MCGIAGMIAKRQEIVRNALPRMVGVQSHRGPDDSGEGYFPFGSRFIGLGHRRLAILDLSAAGHQPMIHPVTGDQIVFNGEIYNFRRIRQRLLAEGEVFRTQCDTEVLLHALTRWGAKCLSDLEGMYAFAFYSAQHRKLLLGRDPLGIKPLYLAAHDESIVFASEVRSVLASGIVSRELDWRGVAGMLAYGAVQHPFTTFRAVKSVAPGTWLQFDAQSEVLRPVVKQYWTFPRPDDAIDETTAVNAVRETLDASVRDHLISDVPVGVFLSSGIDSTLVAGLAARHSPHIRSFSVGYSEHADLSELGPARETAERFGLTHSEIIVDAPQAETTAAEWLQSMDQPSFDGLNVYLISKVVREAGITVALSGLGGDELFCGYSTFRDVPRAARLLRPFRWAPRQARAALAVGLGMGRATAVREKLRDAANGSYDLRSLYFQRRRSMSSSQLQSVGINAATLGLNCACLDPETLAALGDKDDRIDPIWSISQLESTFYMGNMLLRDSDVNGMAHSLEIRVPMLDQRVIDLAFRIPGAVRLGAAPRKHLLRNAFPELLRQQLLDQPKRGFTLPLRRWMLGPLRGLCQDGFAALKTFPGFHPPGLDQIWEAFEREPESALWSRALALSALGIYLEKTAHKEFAAPE